MAGTLFCVLLVLLCVLNVVTSNIDTNSTTERPEGCGWPGGKDRIPTIWHTQELPNPQVDVCKCGRQGKKSWVCDPNGILSYDEADVIDAAINDLRNSTGGCHCGKKCSRSSYLGPNYSGYQLGVLVISEMYSKKRNPSSKDRKKTADKFSDYVRDDYWEFGLCNDDIVILVSDIDRVVYTATGDEVSGIVTDKCVKDITASNKASLSNKDYGKALLGMVQEYNDALNREHACNKPASLTSILLALGVIGGAIGSCVGCVCLRNKFCPTICPNCCGGSSGGGRGHYGHPKHHHRRGSGGSVGGGSVKSNSSGGGGDTF